MTTPSQILVDRDLCVGAGQCVIRAADVFEHDHDGNVQVHHEHVTPQVWEDVVDAVANCPVQAISLHTVDGGQSRVG